MSHPPRTTLWRWPALLILIALMTTSMNGQGQDSYEGYMSGIRSNAVTGPVTFERNGAKFILEPGIRMEEGDVIKTGTDAYAELLLQPGNFLRIGSATEFQVFSDQHDKMRLKLNRGAIVIEILARDGFGSLFYSVDQANELIRVITPNAEVFITRPGIFRINAAGNDQTELLARDGEAVINGHRVKEKRRALASNRTVVTNETDSRAEDNFDVWARQRADSLVKANKSLKRETSWAQNAKEGKQVSVEAPDQESNDNRGRVISAKPGAISFVEAGDEFRQAAGEWQPLTEKSQLATGDTLRTSKSSFAELILFPDLHLRVDGLSEVLFIQLSNDSVSIRVLRGSAILDVARFDRKQIPQIKISGPTTSVVLDNEGNYRIDATPEGEAITIREGKVVFNERLVGSCRRITAGTVIDCDKKRYDNFDFWSQHRGEGQMYNGRMTVAMASHLVRVRRNRFKNTGFWFQQPGQTFFTFVPFTSLLFKSPYGGSYSTALSPRPSVNRIVLPIGPMFRLGPQRIRPQR